MTFKAVMRSQETGLGDTESSLMKKQTNKTTKIIKNMFNGISFAVVTNVLITFTVILIIDITVTLLSF